MIHRVRLPDVLDTNVIYPIDIRDILLWVAHYDLYTPKWSNISLTSGKRDETKSIAKAENTSRTQTVQDVVPEGRGKIMIKTVIVKKV